MHYLVLFNIIVLGHFAKQLKGIKLQIYLKDKKMNLNFLFNSADHIRYQNGIQVAGPFGNVNRCIKVEPNINGCEGYDIKGGIGYIVTIFNLDGDHPIWQNNIQVTPKPMKIISQDANKVVLRGYPVMAMTPMGWIDFDGQDYGLTIFLTNGSINKCVLHMHDRNTDIEYINGKTVQIVKDQNLYHLSIKANSYIEDNNTKEGIPLLVELYNSIVSNPEILSGIKEFDRLGMSFLSMLELGLANDQKQVSIITNLCYYFTSHAINNGTISNESPMIIAHNFSRMLLLRSYPEGFTNSLAFINDENISPSNNMEWTENMWGSYISMTLADFHSDPSITEFPGFSDFRTKLDLVIGETSHSEKDMKDLINTGLDIHQRLFNYLHEKIIIEGDLDL